MAPKKRGGKRAASGGAKRGRPSKKQKEEQETEQEAKQTEQTEQAEEAGDDTQMAAETTADSKDSDAKQQTDDSSSKQSAAAADETKTDQEQQADADTAKAAASEADAEEAQTDKKAEDKSELLEKGHLYFFYRPKVDAKEVKGPDDVQKLYILMSPEGAEGKPAKEEEAEAKRKDEREATEATEGGKQHRLLVVSSKTLPGLHQRARNPWCFVDAVGSLEEVEHKLERYSYDTKTKGHREIQPARLCGEARYDVIKHSGDQKETTHLVYELELPEQPTEVQEAFNIQKEAQFLVNVKNPDFNTAARPSNRPYAGFQSGEKAKIPEHLMKHFAGKRQAEVRYAPVASTEFFDLPHAELVLIAVKKDVHDEPADFEDIVKQLEDDVEADVKEGLGEDTVYKQIEMDQKEHPAALEEFK